MSDGYPPDWDSRRRRVYKRDSYKCQNCGNQDDELHAHHIVPISKGGTHKISNLITLCSDCHTAIHGNTMAPSSYSKELLKDIQRILLKSDIPTEEMVEISKILESKPYIMQSAKEIQRELLKREVDTITIKLISRTIEIRNNSSNHER
jgi:signal recognition particle GTPase